MIRAHRIGETSAFLGQTCALCKQEFDVGDRIVICPEDGSRHHAHCWEANNNHCTAYGCRGEGAIGAPLPPPTGRPVRERPRPRVVAASNQSPSRPEPARRANAGRPAGSIRPVPGAPGSKVRTLPAGGVGCARTCLTLAIIGILVVLALACLGVWAFMSYTSGSAAYLPSFTPLVETVKTLGFYPFG
jgi:hypothetical protein